MRRGSRRWECRRRARRPGGSQVELLRDDGAVAAFQPVGRDDVNGPAEQRLIFDAIVLCRVLPAKVL
jgi:hypothetical protein